MPRNRLIDTMTNKSNHDWWRGAVIYQIYPRSFADGNGDGVGDLIGIEQHLDYVADLGVDAIWLSPFFKSPMKDFGYDISDYRDVDPLFGTLDDFDRIVDKAHRRGLKILIDQVLSHTSDQHTWFQESRRDKTNAKADWYVWADPQPDGTPPNNWLSIFGGPAWQWDSHRHQYYLHNFLVSQPDLNHHNPEVQEQLLKEVQFRLDRGVAGLRLDAVNFCHHDRQLRSNPPRSRTIHDLQSADERNLANPYFYQQHRYNHTQPETVDFLKQLRALFDRYEGITSVGETDADDRARIMAEYTTGNNRLHMAYSFSLLSNQFGARFIQEIMEDLESKIGDGWPCWSLGNHDVRRVMTRWARGNEDLARVVMALSLTLRGSLCIYQGEELGLEEAELSYDQLQDPWGRVLWPAYKGRDGCRTPMPWTTQGPQAGFSDCPPWLPIPESHRRKAVDHQEHDPNSMLHGYRRFLHWRQHHSALKDGTITFLKAPDDCIAFIRRNDREAILAAFNLGEQPSDCPLWESWQPLENHGFAGIRKDDGIHLPPFQAYFSKTTSV